MDAKLIQDLVDVGSGKLRHAYMGSCPDALEGTATRDRTCVAFGPRYCGQPALVAN